jgi:hypothetical protein
MCKSVRATTALMALLLLGGAAGYPQESASASPTASNSHAIRAVLASRQGSEFRYFPHSAGTARCAIPFVFRRVKGICSTQAFTREANSGQILVVFTERWPWREFHYSGAPRRPLHHSWTFDLLPSGRVVFVKSTGDFPPNLAR